MFRKFMGLLPAALLLSGMLQSCSPAASQPQPVVTASAAPAEIPTLAVVPTALPLGVDVQKQADGTTLVRDLDNRYEFVLMQPWMAIDVSKKSIDALTQGSVAQDPEFLKLAQNLGSQQTDAFRLVGIDTDDRFARAANPTLVLVTAIPDRISAMLPMKDVAKMIADTVFTGGSVTNRVVQNASGLEVAVVEGPYEYLSTDGNTFKSRSKVMGFQANNRVVLIQFITPAELGVVVLPDTDQIIETIHLTAP